MKQSEGSYQLYKQKEEESRITDELDQNKITNVSVAEAPAQPQLPARPNRLLNIVLGIVLGLLLSGGSVFVVELMRDTVTTPRELEALTGLRVLVSVPKNGRRPRAIATEESPKFLSRHSLNRRSVSRSLSGCLTKNQI